MQELLFKECSKEAPDENLGINLNLDTSSKNSSNDSNDECIYDNNSYKNNKNGKDNKFSKEETDVLETLLSPERFVSKLTKFKPVDYQLNILKSKSKRIAMVGSRQTGKSAITSLKAIHYSFTHSNATVLVTAPTQRQSSLLFNTIKRFIFDSKHLSTSIVNTTMTSIILTNGSRIYALPCGSDGSGIRGFAADLIIVDEAAYVPDEVYTAIVPMLAHTDGALMLLSSPGGKRGYFYQACEDEFKKFPEVYVIHSSDAVKAGIIPQSFIDEQKKIMSELEFMREFSATFMDASNFVFPADIVDPCRDDYKADIMNVKEEPGWVRFMGIDWGKMRASSVVATVKKKGKKVKIEHMKEFKRTDYGVVIRYVINFCESHPTQMICPDRGVGERQMEELKEANLKVRGIAFQSMKVKIMEALQLRFQNKTVTIPKDISFFKQLTSYMYEITKNGRIVFIADRKLGDHHIDAVALANCAAGVKGTFVKGITREVIRNELGENTKQTMGTRNTSRISLAKQERTDPRIVHVS